MILIRFDEDISYRIPNALAALLPPDEFTLESAATRNERGLKDIDWIAEFKARGGVLLVSGDERMRDRPFEREALSVSGLIAVFPPESRFWNALKLFGQAAFLIRWFPAIIELARRAEPGEHFRLPASFTTDPDRILTLRRLSEGPRP